MTTFEKCDAIRRSLLTRAGEMLCYSWSNDFKAENMMGIIESVKKWAENENTSFDINPNDLTRSEMELLGFGSWSENSIGKLIPIWLHPFLADELRYEDLNGNVTITKKKDIDNDHRFGYLAYNAIPKDAG